MLTYPWLSLIPPIVVVIAGFAIQQLNIALSAGIISAVLIAQNGNLGQAFLLMVTRIWEQISTPSNIYLYCFLLAISCIVVLLNKGAGPRAFVSKMCQKINKKSTIELTVVASSIALSLDDYLSILTVGNMMKRVTDKFGIPREKVAFYTHGLAGPMVILLPISSWVATITGYLSQAGISATISPKTVFLADPFFVYLGVIPFIFYSFLILISILFIIKTGISFGPIGVSEKKMLNVHKQQTASTEESYQTKESIFDFFFPLSVLIGSVIAGILYTGDSFLFGGTASFIEAFKNNEHIFLILFSASALTLLITTILGFIRNTVSCQSLPGLLFEGYIIMKDAILMVILASTLGALLKADLMTGHYLASIVLKTVSLTLIPFICFVISLLCTLATGSAWGTFSFMTAIAIPMLASMYNLELPISPQEIPLLFPVLGAIFSGGICGDHLSPFSETTIMTASSTDIEPLHHSYSQLPYALPATLGTGICFLIVGFLSPFSRTIQIFLPLMTGCVVTLFMLWIVHRESNK